MADPNSGAVASSPSPTTSPNAPDPPAPATTSPFSAALPAPTGGPHRGPDGSMFRWLWLVPVAALPFGVWRRRKVWRSRRP